MPDSPLFRWLFAGALLAVVLTLLPSNAQAAARKKVINGLEIGVDEKNGGIVSLRYPGVGGLLATETEAAGLLDLAFPLASYMPMRLATRFSHAAIEETGQTLTITWPELAPSRTHVSLPPGSVSARV